MDNACTELENHWGWKKMHRVKEAHKIWEMIPSDTVSQLWREQGEFFGGEAIQKKHNKIKYLTTSFLGANRKYKASGYF